ncbi:Fe(3+) ABC transporter substrate-binding protein [Endozoicomonas sp. GU-1]|uniref:Fe(3+) ABC transporter substrate-binding protein n=1 Tax=Endozoicomonas sp. GU-1 TaxID=3009078 RepID=UPI0022B40D08|nr:Fe(3+) ABC transporter substrate-binding protein [Endozoicomonas sp. GU-1]WBA81726.1 Fe(3+) ABC transporter substrate-binding protein [Endozoicomonas sp. GU-1]WBA84681.1 Fe(3+) ABC transporter substrate-binding protein [Endozoicomonas sp. GU-1]
MKKLLSITSAIAISCSSLLAQAAEEVNIYSYRQPFLIEPMLKDFEQETGVKVNVVFAKKGLEERIEREGKFSPADVVLTSDMISLFDLVDRQLVQPVNSKTINENIPVHLRDPDNQWYSLTMRVRNIYSSKRSDKPVDINYEDLASSKFKGKICTRSGKHPYNIGLVASMIAHNGEAQTKQWLEGVKANLARRPQGNDRAQVKAIKEGVCDVSLGNSYYFGKMMENDDQKAWADAVYINFPNQKTVGSHVNISGMVMAKYAPNKDNALRLMEYLASEEAQSIYARDNMEYPVNPNVPVSDTVAAWGEFKADPLPISDIAANRTKAQRLLDEVKFDL